MKANEIMIGDLVTFKDCQNDEHPIVVKIWQVNADGEALVLIDGSDVLDEISIDDEVVGIPLTPEILEKNGWKLISDTPYKLEYFWSTGAVKEYADARILVLKDDDNVWRWDFPILDIHLYRGDINLTKFSYLHELQHALRLCGIEKEIVL